MSDAVPYELIQQAYEYLTLDPYTSGELKFVTVLDADAILSSVDYQCRNGFRPRLPRLAGSRSSAVFAEDHVYGEVYRGLRKFSALTGIPEETMRGCWEDDYLPDIRWVETDGNGLTDARVAEVTDATDRPTAVLASLIAPCLVLAEDKSLRRPGYAPDRWRDAAGHGTNLIAGIELQTGGTLLIGGPPAGIIVGGVKLGEKVGIPWWGSVLIMAGIVYLILRSPDRRRTISDNVLPALEVGMTLMEEAYAQERNATQSLKKVIFQPALPATSKQQVATVLARTREPLLAKEVQELIEVHYEDEVPTVTEVRAILTSGSEFAQPERYRWQLGRRSGPWRGHLPS